jgi:hypothetical protein
LIAAGLCGGVSLLIKVIGAYYIAGVLLFLAFLEQSDAQSDAQGDVQTDERNGDGRSSSRVAGAGKYAVPYLAFSAASLLLFWTTVLYLFRSRLGNGELFHFLMPATVLVGLILFGERYVRNVAAKRRFLRLLKLTVPFGFGVLVPVLVFLAPYSRSGSVGQFFSGVTSSAAARSAGLAVLRPMSIDKSIFALALAGLVAAAMYRREFQGRAVGAAVALGLAVALAKAQTTGGIVTSVWYSAAGLTPLVVVAGAVFVLAGQKEAGESRRKRQQVMALISLAAMCSLVQYPFAAPIYLCYALPLTILAALAIVTSARKQAGTIIFSAVAGFYLVFAVVTLVPDYIYELTHTVGKMDRMKSLRAGGLQIEGAAFFDDLAQFLRARSPNGQMYAGNDCPELYFLSGRQNVTRDDGGATTEDVLKALQSDDLNLVVINEHPFFPSAQMSPEVTGAVTARFPNSVRFGAFRVFWKKN